MRGIRLILATLLFWGCGSEGNEDQDATDTVEDAGDTVEDVPADVSEEDVTAPETGCAVDSDCDDSDPCTADICDTDYGTCSHEAVDADGDGYTAMEVDGTECMGGTDCDDSDADVHPDADLDCTGEVDMDCDGLSDPDEDEDGYETTECGGDDCDDGDALAFPGSMELDCELDRDCNGNVDADNDDDGYDSLDCGGTDCDDFDTGYNPGIAVSCTTEDHNCNGNPDNDEDGDGHVAYICTGGDDCDDADAAVLLGECDGVSDCCDGCWQINGCWLDPTTGYMWEDPPMAAEMSWSSAMSYCDGLSLAGHGAGQWHLPTISELRTLIRGCTDTEDGGACGVTDSCLGDTCDHDCSGCSPWGGSGSGGCYWDPALDGDCDSYWSSSLHADIPSAPWMVAFNDGGLLFQGDWLDYDVRCVHTGT